MVQSTVYNLQSAGFSLQSLRYSPRVRMHPGKPTLSISILRRSSCHLSSTAVFFADSSYQTLNNDRLLTQRIFIMGVKGLWELLAPCGRRCYQTVEMKLQFTIEVNTRITCNSFLYIYQGFQSKLWTGK